MKEARMEVDMAAEGRAKNGGGEWATEGKEAERRRRMIGRYTGLVVFSSTNITAAPFTSTPVSIAISPS